MKQIGFIGVGIMGKPMVRNLMKAGFSVQIYARHPENVQDVIQEGAVLKGSIADTVSGADAVITMVGFPPDVEDVYFGMGKILETATAGMYLIDMTTTSPSLDQKIYKSGKEKGLHVLDAPVTGGDTGAINGTLSILVGGDQEDFRACMDIFQAMGTNINYQGPSGSGQHAKLANQIMIAGNMSGLCEALAYAEKKGLDREVLLKSVATGAAGSAQLDAFGEKIVAGNYDPGFMLKHFIKDMKIVLEEATPEGLNLEVLATALKNYQELEDAGLSDKGTQTLIRHYIH